MSPMGQSHDEAPVDPRGLWEQAIGMEREAHQLRIEAIRGALARCHGRVHTAALLLGMSRSHLRNLLDNVDGYPGLREYAAKLRAGSGYERGRAPAHLRVVEDDDG
jgi:phosphoserine phosphatase